MRLRGADGPAFDTIAVSRKNSSLPPRRSFGQTKPIEYGGGSRHHGLRRKGARLLQRYDAHSRRANPRTRCGRSNETVLEGKQTGARRNPTNMTGAACDALARNYIADMAMETVSGTV